MRVERREERELQEVAWRGRDEATIRFRNRLTTVKSGV